MSDVWPDVGEQRPLLKQFTLCVGSVANVHGAWEDASLRTRPGKVRQPGGAGPSPAWRDAGETGSRRVLLQRPQMLVTCAGPRAVPQQGGWAGSQEQGVHASCGFQKDWRLHGKYEA